MLARTSSMSVPTWEDFDSPSDACLLFSAARYQCLRELESWTYQAPQQHTKLTNKIHRQIRRSPPAFCILELVGIINQIEERRQM
jgi:hypothetical protein